MFWTEFQTIGHSLKYFGPSQKTLALSVQSWLRACKCVKKTYFKTNTGAL